MYHQPIRVLDETLLDSVHEVPDKVALVAGDLEYTYTELSVTARSLAAAFLARGVKRGDRIAIYLDNGFSCAAAIYAALLSGAVFLAINPQTKSDKLRFILDDSEAVLLVTDARLTRFFMPAISGARFLATVFCTGSAVFESQRTSGCPIIESFERIVSSTSQIDNPVFHIPNDLAALIYTSGSTGNPKGVMMSHESMVFSAGSLIQYLRLDSTDRILNVLPLAFDYGLYQLLMSVYLGATLVLEQSFVYPAQTLKCIEKQQVTVFPGVPTVFTMLISMHRRSPLEFPSVRRITNTAAALPTDYNSDLQEIFPHALIYRMYGLTECKRVCYLEPELVNRKPSSVGNAIPGTEVFLLSDDGCEVKPGEPGILHVRGPHVMRGYWKRPEESSKVLGDGNLPGERVLCTQDWFTKDEDGDLYFLGRSDDIIKTRGEKVSPIEIENVIYGIPGVREVAVIGVPDGLLGQSIKAVIVTENGASLTQKDIQRHCAQMLENHMVPKTIEFTAELPRTSTGKIRKAGLRPL